MNIKKLGIAFLALTATVTGLSAQEGLYLGAKGGLNMRSIDSKINNNKHLSYDMDKDLSGGLVLGTRLGYGVRVETELASHRSHHKDINSMQSDKLVEKQRENYNSYAMMLNGLYDLPVEGPVKPHVGAGIGYAKINRVVKGQEIYNFEKEVEGTDGKKTTKTEQGLRSATDRSHHKHFAWQALAGMNYEVSPELELTTDYQYYRDAKDHASHAVVFGLQHYF